jgi:SAM-dependent methyltransferase
MYNPDKYFKFEFKDTFYEPSLIFALSFLSGLRYKIEGLKLFDLGCGPGKVAPYFADIGIKYLEGGDINEEALEIAKSANYYEKLYLLESNNMPKLSNVFDVVWASNVHFCKSQSSYKKLTELNKFASSILKPNGIFIVITAAPGIIDQAYNSIRFERNKSRTFAKDFEEIKSIVKGQNGEINIFEDLHISKEVHLKSFQESGFSLIQYSEPNSPLSEGNINPVCSVYILQK